MKHLITALAFAALAPFAAASSFCAQVGDIAELSMGFRQVGLSPVQVTQEINAITDNKMTDIIAEMVDRAFKAPRAFTPEMELRLTQGHRAHFEMACLRSRRR